MQVKPTISVTSCTKDAAVYEVSDPDKVGYRLVITGIDMYGNPNVTDIHKGIPAWPSGVGSGEWVGFPKFVNGKPDCTSLLMVSLIAPLTISLRRMP